MADDTNIGQSLPLAPSTSTAIHRSLPMENNTNAELGTIYLIHFKKPFGHAKHYLGWTSGDSIDKRIDRHRKGRGARLLAVLNASGIGWDVCRTWKNVDKNFERVLKRSGKSYLCPVCNPKALNQMKGPECIKPTTKAKTHLRSRNEVQK